MCELNQSVSFQCSNVQCISVHFLFHLTAISFKQYVTWLRLNWHIFLHFRLPEAQPLTSVNKLAFIFSHQVSTTWFIQWNCDFQMQVPVFPICWCWNPSPLAHRGYKSESLKDNFLKNAFLTTKKMQKGM